MSCTSRLVSSSPYAAFRLRVKISDSENKQYTIPDSVISRPAAPSASFTKTSDLVFNYDPSPFAFWITRRSSPDATPLFDTRLSSLPTTPIPSVIADDNTTALDGFPLVFENQYLQVKFYLLVYITSRPFTHESCTCSVDLFIASGCECLWSGRSSGKLRVQAQCGFEWRFHPNHVGPGRWRSC